MLIDKIPEPGNVIDAGDGNRIITSSDSVLVNTKITFNGRNNILKMGGRCHLKNSLIGFNGDESVTMLLSNRHDYYLNLSLHHNNVFHMGTNNYMNGRLTIILSEQKHVFFGNGSAISFGIWIRTADPHLVYSVDTKARVNPSKSVFVGDHVWLGQSAILLKGTQIGSGSIIGAGSVVAGKKIPSNTSWAGNPVRQVGQKMFWSSQCVHRWRGEETRKYQTMLTDNYIYMWDENEMCSFEALDAELSSCTDAVSRLEVLENLEGGKNRFYV